MGTFHRSPAPSQELSEPTPGTFEAESGESDAEESLYCWIKPSRYYDELMANLRSRQASKSLRGELWALTASDDCPCRGAFACRRADGACTPPIGGKQCADGSSMCEEVAAEVDPEKPLLAARPEVCALAYHHRAADAGNVDAMHVLSHAFSNGVRGTVMDTAKAFAWSKRAMELGDARGRFDVAYSLEFGLGVEVNESRAHAMYRELLEGQAVPLAARVSSALALVSASGRYLAGLLTTQLRPWQT